MINYLIIDDEPLAHDLIIKFAKDIPYLQLKKQCYNALEGLDYLSTQEVDLIFLDLNMPKLKGFDFLRSLRHPPQVIVTTAYQEHALEGFELNVTDYLLKPFSFERFVAAVHKVRAARKKQTAVTTSIETTIQTTGVERIFIKSDKKYHQIRLADILYIEAYGNYTKVYLSDQMLLNHNSISAMLTVLPSANFRRIHKSFIVALDKIEAVEGNQLLIAEQKVPVGQTYRSAIAKIIKG